MYIPDNVNINCGIYRIVNRRNGKFYVGSTKNAKTRKNSHFNNLNKGKHHSTYLQRAFNKEEDKSVFEFQMFIYCEEKIRTAIEQNVIDIMKPDYNEAKKVGVPAGWNKGQSLTEEHKSALSNAKQRASKKRHVVAKLTERDVIQILKFEDTLQNLAKTYDVKEETISKILRNKTWKYLYRDKIWTVSDIRKKGWTSEKRERQAKTSSEANKFANLSHEQRSKGSKKREQNFTKEQKRERAMKGVEARRLKKLARLAVAHPHLDWPSGGSPDRNANALLIGYLL